MRREDVDLSRLATEVAEEISRAQPGRRVDFVHAPGCHAPGDAQLLRPQIPDDEGIVPPLIQRVSPVHAIVPVDLFIPGCPPSAKRIRAVLEQIVSGKPVEMTSEQIEEIGLKRLARVTVRWEGFRDEHGNPAECNTANAYELYKAMPHIARQVEEFVLDPANFGQEGEKVEPLTAETYMAAVAGN
jgi:hypothetical protein